MVFAQIFTVIRMCTGDRKQRRVKKTRHNYYFGDKRKYRLRSSPETARDLFIPMIFISCAENTRFFSLSHSHSVSVSVQTVCFVVSFIPFPSRLFETTIPLDVIIIFRNKLYRVRPLPYYHSHTFPYTPSTFNSFFHTRFISRGNQQRNIAESSVPTTKFQTRVSPTTPYLSTL